MSPTISLRLRGGLQHSIAAYKPPTERMCRSGTFPGEAPLQGRFSVLRGSPTRTIRAPPLGSLAISMTDGLSQHTSTRMWVSAVPLDSSHRQWGRSDGILSHSGWRLSFKYPVSHPFRNAINTRVVMDPLTLTMFKAPSFPTWSYVPTHGILFKLKPMIPHPKINHHPYREQYFTVFP